MPASRSPSHRASAWCQTTGGSDTPEDQSVPNSNARGLELSAMRRRRAPNAFIVFRSYIIANKLFPPELKHQNDVLCWAAEKWKAITLDERVAFFNIAEENKLRRDAMAPSESKPPPKRRSKTAKMTRTVTNNEQPKPDSSQYHTSCPENRLNIELQDMPAPVLNSFTLSDMSPIHPSAPQAVHPIPPSLLNWGYESDEYDETWDDFSDLGLDLPSSTHDAHAFLSSGPYQITAPQLATTDQSTHWQLNRPANQVYDVASSIPFF